MILARPAAFGFGLAGDRADHAIVEVDALDLDVRDLDAQGVGLLVEHVLDVYIELVPLGEHLVEVMLAQYRPQRGLRELAGRLHIGFDLDHCPLGIDDPESR